MSRSAHGLDSTPDHPDWRVRGACNRHDPDLWGSTELSDRAQAVWVCKWECEVKEACYDWADRNRELVDQMVYGAVYWTKGQGASRRRLPRPALVQPTPSRPTGRPAQRRRPEVRSHVTLRPHLEDIRALVASGESIAAIADRYGRTYEVIRQFLGRHQIPRVSSITETAGGWWWRCALCPAGGPAPDKATAEAAYAQHYDRCHREDA